ncbi:hypothetical protein AAVH_25812 [Aphelenchoides avenae]|nr:hypothetical protein AAVH_25812 [Aphelenchus avenae]
MQAAPKPEANGTPLLPANIKLPLFSGPDVDKTFKEHLESLNDLANALGWSKGQLCAHLPLAGKARAAYKEVEDDKKNKWTDISTEMATRMTQREDTTSRSMQKFLATRQNCRPVVEYGGEIRRLAARAYPSSLRFSDQQREHVSINKFRDGLDADLKKVVIFGEKKNTLSDEIASAIDAEAKLKQLQSEQDQQITLALDKAEKLRLREEINSSGPKLTAYGKRESKLLTHKADHGSACHVPAG